MTLATFRRLRKPLLLAVCTLPLALLVAWSAGAGAAKASAGRSGDPTRPNIVFILTDDLSWNLITPQIAPHIYDLMHQGETFDHYFVTDSLCCPSRATIFTGLYPHDTHVLSNLPPNGGFWKFQSEHLARRTFAVALHKVGYQTSMLGKYLNGYGNKDGNQYKASAMNATDAPIPQGWTDWHVANKSGYAEYNFEMNDNGKFDRHTGDNNYGVDVLNRDAQKFITANAHRPFFVEAATFAPHRPFTPAIRNKDDFPGLTEPRDPSFDTQNINPPPWLGQRPALTPAQVAQDDAIYRKRAQDVESVDKLVADTEATLAREHLTKRTYIVFSSDNGYHLGQHRLLEGKQTAFDTDIRVPLIVVGPGVPQGRIVSQVVQNTDLCPTFEELGGAAHARPIDGTSFVPLLHPAATAPVWPTVALIEHHGGTKPSDPDSDGGGSNPTSYQAIRIVAPHLPGFTGPVDSVYVEYARPAHTLEYYDITTDPDEIDNVADQLAPAQKDELHRILEGLVHCHNQARCWAAGIPES
jgi:N-acetylglucosamine-6-sulfatase